MKKTKTKEKKRKKEKTKRVKAIITQPLLVTLVHTTSQRILSVVLENAKGQGVSNI